MHGAKLWEIYTPASLVASFLFWPYPRVDGFAFPVHLLGWTLNYEMFFYAVFAVAIVLPRRAGGRRRVTSLSSCSWRSAA